MNKLITLYMVKTGYRFPERGFWGRGGKGRRILYKIGVRATFLNLYAEYLSFSK